MEFLSDNWKPLLFFAVLIVAYLHQRLIRKRVLDSDDVLALIWISVAMSLTLAYVVGTFDFFLNKATALGFKLNDVNVIALPGAVTIAERQVSTNPLVADVTVFDVPPIVENGFQIR